ncbi:excinuclease ABC subunit UvrA [Lactobacillus bombicola]|uniref:UvrABC system protein A n=1 Tax=Lactobacillus bombicola TaxID=1505723 RepID=A0A396SQZ7_9LACO|nr:excinuclease ABC subunit UvrA [Lactobacillus bombicola]RHW54362.1 excinuclease ABC subunit UvrA [Lactobacillus bombicola]
MANNQIVIRGAREHNLKNISLTIPKDKLVVITGLSGSGKSSLAFDTLYAEGRRRYVQSLSSYARQFLGQMDKPDVDAIDGLNPAISIDQKTTSHNPRSTVGTVTEINDYLRLLWARVGHPICPNDQTPIERQSVEQMVDRILELPDRSRIQLLAPVIRAKRGAHQEVFKRVQRAGYVRVIVDGEMHEIGDDFTLDKNKRHTIDIVVDRLVIKDGIRSRLFDSVEAALRLSDGYMNVDVINSEILNFSEYYACPKCGFTVGEMEPRLFSFNAPFGACPDCDGLGIKLAVDEELVIPDQSKTLAAGAIAPWKNSKYYSEMLTQACAALKIPLDKPFAKLTKRQKEIILHGSTKKIKFHVTGDFGVNDTTAPFEGVMENVEKRYLHPMSKFMRDVMAKYMAELTCSTCHGKRLNRKALAVKIMGKDIAETSSLAISKAIEFFNHIQLSEQEEVIAKPILKEVRDRLTFLDSVGLDYLTLSRTANTLSGGEAQRIRLATQIGSNLSGVMYVLDEPSIGLHQRDNDRLIAALKRMRDLGNSLIVVEHDDETMRQADYLIDMGPGAGSFGGKVMAAGTPKEVEKNTKSLTGQYLAGKKFVPVPLTRRKGNGKKITITGAAENNLKDIKVDFPLGKLIVVTGVSGSGKSTLINMILKRVLAQKLNRNQTKPGKYQSISGYKNIEKVIDIDQSPIGRTPRSNPATYTSVFDDIRSLFAQTNEAKLRGYTKARFSFNVKGGRCEACHGDGIIKIEMNFLPDVYVPCEICHGNRYNSETLEVIYRNKNIAQVLDMTIVDACDFFKNIPKIARKLQTIVDVGLGYVKLGQSATTLSGGEAQRMKLAAELQKLSTGKNFYILDEPTTGLHTDDIKRLLEVLQRLVDQGNTVLIIEHNLDVIKSADWLIDLGPEGGERGGTIIATGTPEELVQVKESYTGQYLKPVLKRDKILTESVNKKANE